MHFKWTGGRTGRIVYASLFVLVAVVSGRRLQAQSIITTVAGNGTEGCSGDGGPATGASVGRPWGVAVDTVGDLFIAQGAFAHCIRRVDAVTGIITTVAGTGTAGFSGDGGPATSAMLNDPSDVATDGSGNLFIADNGNNRIRRVDVVTGIITTVAGNGIGDFSGDGGPATSASLRAPWGVAVDSLGNIFIADAANQRVRRVDAASSIITTVAGNGQIGFRDEDELGPATSARLNWPLGVAVDDSGDFFIADTNNSRIREVGADGIIFTVTGNSFSGYNGDGDCGPCTSLNNPYGVAVDASGTLLIGDSGNFRIRRMDGVTTIVTTMAGNGNLGFSGDGGPATSAMLGRPWRAVMDGSGNLFIADTGNHRVRQVTP